MATKAISEAQQQKQWQAQDDLRTMQRAAEVQADAARLKAAQAEAKKQMDVLSKVATKPPAKRK